MPHLECTQSKHSETGTWLLPLDPHKICEGIACFPESPCIEQEGSKVPPSLAPIWAKFGRLHIKADCFLNAVGLHRRLRMRRQLLKRFRLPVSRHLLVVVIPGSRVAGGR